MLLLSFLYLLQDISHVKLHASDEGHLQHKGTHEVIEYLTAFFLEVYCLVLLEIVEDLVVGHRQLHHSIDLTLQFFFVSLFEILEIIELLSIALHFLFLYRPDSLPKFCLTSDDLKLSLIIFDVPFVLG